MKKKYFFKSILFLLTFFLNYQYITAQDCTVNPDIPKEICSNETLQLVGKNEGNVAVPGVWSQVGGPSVHIIDPNNLNTTVTGYTAGNTYIFRLTATCGDGQTVHLDVDFTIHPISTANAGDDIESCPTTLNLSANTASGTGETGEWTFQGNGASVSGLTDSDPNSSITLSQTDAGITTLRWTITGPAAPVTGGFCSSYDEVDITNYGGESPVSAGSDQTLSQCYTATQSTNLDGTFGGNNLNGQQGTWTMVSGPNYATIDDEHDNETEVSGLIEGTYVFRWEVTGTCASGSDEVTIIVPAATQDVTSVTDFPTQTYCYAETNIVLEGTTPEFANEEGYWTQTQGPSATIANPSSATTTVSGLDGTSNYRFRYVIENTETGCTSGRDNVDIRFRDKPTVAASIAEPNLPCGITDAAITVARSTGAAVRYKIVSGPYTMGWRNAPTTTNVDFTNNNTEEPNGIYVLQFESYISGIGCTSDFDELTISVSEAPEASEAGSEQVLNCDVVATVLQGNIPTIGSGVWTQVSKPDGEPDAIIDDITNPSSPISGLEVGKYTFRWLISAGNNCPPTQDDVDVVVSKTSASSAAGNAKTVCHSTEITLAGNKLLPNETGEWTVTPSAGISFADANSPSTSVTGLNATNTDYTFTWSVTNGCGTEDDDVIISTSSIQGPSISDAGTDQCENSGTITVGMTGNNPAVGTGTWTIVEGPNTPTIVSPNAHDTDINGLVDGKYKIIWAIEVPTCEASVDTLNVTIKTTDNITSVAGGDQSICGTSATMSANAAASGATGTWVQVSGSAGYTISDVNSPTATFSDLMPGRYEFKWLVTQGEGVCPSEEDNIVFTISEPPSTSTTATDKSVCDGNTATISANDPTSGNGLWTIISSPNSPNIASVTSPTTTVTGLTSGEYTFRWTISSGPDCAENLGVDDIVVQVSAIADAGGDIDLCNANSVILEGTDGTDGTWSLITGSPIPTISNNDYNTAMINDLGANETYTFRYTLPDIFGCTGPYTSDMELTTSPYGSEPSAGDDQEICTSNGTTITMDADNPGTGTGSWIIVSVPPTANPIITTPALNTSNVTDLDIEGVYIFEWNVDYNTCETYKDVMRVNVYNPPTTSIAGTDQTNACELTAQLEGNLPTVGIGTWTLISSPAGNTATIEIVNINTPDTRIVNPSHTGTYTFRWTIKNGNVCNESTSDVDITFTDDPPTTPDADADRDLCNVSDITMSGNDPAGNGTGTWTQVSGPNASNIVNPNDHETDITGMIPGTYEFQWKIDRGGCTLTDNMIVENSAPTSTADAGETQNLCKFDSPILTADTPENGTGQWSFVSGTTTPTILTPDNTTTNVTGTDLGTYTFRWTITNGVCADETADIIVNIADIPLSTLAVTDNEVCQGADGNISIISSENTVTYRLYDGTTLLDTKTGDGNKIDFIVPNGNLSVGENYFSYTATNISNCKVDFINQPMVKVNANPDIPLPVSDDVVCEGSNATITISGSDSGADYEAFNGTTPVGNGAGNGGDLDITFATDGTWVGVNTVTIRATSTGTGCVSNLSDQASITVNANPLNDKSVDGNTVCEGSDGIITIAASESGVDYEAFIGATSVGTGSGTGNDLEINILSANIPTVNTYTIGIEATSTTGPTNCSVQIVDDGTITVINSPTTNQTLSANTVCYGTDATITVNSTQNGVNYDVYNGATLIGTGVGNGGSIDIACNTTSLNAGNNVVTLTATNAGCSDGLDNTASLNIHATPVSSLSVSDFTACEGGDANITISSSVNSVGYEAFINSISVWTGAGTGSDLDITIDKDKLSVGENEVTVVATNTNCSINLADKSNVTINKNPEFNLFTEGGTNCSTDDAIIIIEDSEENIIYQLFLGTTSLASAQGNSGDLSIPINSDLLEVGENTIKIVATNATTSCISDLSNEPIVIVEMCNIIVYDGFTPNDDGKNDKLIITGLDKKPKHTVTIFNRWGNKVYEASPYLSDWDGTNMFGVSIGSNKLPVGTYFYIIDPGDGGKVQKGYIYLDY